MDTKIQELPKTGLLRIKQVLKFIPISRSSWYAGVKTGKYPKSYKLSERVAVWHASDIRNLIESIKSEPYSIDKVIK